MCKKKLYAVSIAIVMVVAVVMFFPAMGTASSFDLSLTMTGTGKGTVKFSTGDACSDTCKLGFLNGTAVQLNATAPPGVTFNGWTGCDQSGGATCWVTMTSVKSISADFTGPNLTAGSVQGQITYSFNPAIGVYNAMVIMTREYDTGACSGNCISITTNFEGKYLLSNIVPGTYTLNFLNPPVPVGSGMVSTNNQWFYAKHSRASADLITINEGSFIMNIDAQYPPVGAIAGKVTDVNGVGLANVTVRAFDLDEEMRGTAWTDSNGEYTIQNLPSGTYIINYRANLASGPGVSQNMITQVAYVTVTAPYNVTGINAALGPGRTISGSITNKDGLPIVAAVNVIGPNGSNISGSASDSTGAYMVRGIAPGSYKVLFRPIQQDSGVIDATKLYSREFYGGTADYENASVVTVTDGADVSNINGVLEATGPAVISSTQAAGAVRIKRDFGAEVVGMSSYRSFLLQNAGTANLSLGTLSKTGQDFLILNDRCSGVTLSPLKICTFQVAFVPQSEGIKTGVITVPSNDRNVPAYTISLTGSGGAATGSSNSTGVPYSAPPYTSVTVTPIPQVNLTFSNVSSPGDATVTAITSLSTPTIPNFRMLNGASYEIDTTASFSGNITVCINYDPATMGNPANEPNLRLFHFEISNSTWRDITILPVNTISHTICGVTSSLSPFVVAEPTLVFNGFFSPVYNIPTVNNAKAGQTIPVIWRITDSTDMPVSDPASFKNLTSFQIDCNNLSGESTSPIEEYSAGSSGLQYSGDGYWQFNWKTPKTYAGQCRNMVLTLGDGSAHEAEFTFNK